MIAGIDISSYQKAIDWPKAHLAGVDFAIIKASEGNASDPMYNAHHDGAQAAGVLCGAYHFLLRGTVTGINQQVDKFLAVLNHGIPPILAVDCEQHPNKLWTPVAEDARLFCSYLEQLTGKTPWVYTSPGFWGAWNNPAWGYQYPLWQAQYTRYWPQQMPPWATWRAWQWMSTARIAGINSNVDLDWFNGTRDDWK